MWGGIQHGDTETRRHSFGPVTQEAVPPCLRVSVSNAFRRDSSADSKKPSSYRNCLLPTAYCLLLFAFCLLFAACGDGRRDREIGPDTARRELFLRGYAYKEPDFLNARSEERRVGKECRSRWSPYH